MISVGPGKMVEPGVVVYWFGADLYYANVSHFAEQARTLAAHGQGSVRWLVVDAGAITSVDCSADSALGELQQELA